MPPSPNSTPQVPRTERTWFIVTSLLFCNVIGLYFVWKNPRWTVQTKKIVTAVFAAVMIASFAYSESPAGKREAAREAAQEKSDSQRYEADQARAQQQERVKAAAAKATEMRVSADDLITAYADNEVAANKRFDGKRFIVRGTASRIGTSIGSLVVDLAGSSGSLITCSFDKDKADQLSKLHQGDSVSIEGVGRGMPLGTPVMDDCTVAQ